MLLSKFEDNSVYNFKRIERKNEEKNIHAINCSSTVCRNAENQPFKYLCKYFNIKTDEKTLKKVEDIFNNFSAI